MLIFMVPKSIQKYKLKKKNQWNIKLFGIYDPSNDYEYNDP